MASKTYDVVVIGGGPGGYGCAIRLGPLKQKVICVEKDEVGGVSELGLRPEQGHHRHEPHLRGKVKQGAHTTVLLTDNARIDANKLQDWKEGIVRKLTGGIRGTLQGQRRRGSSAATRASPGRAR